MLSVNEIHWNMIEERQWNWIYDKYKRYDSGKTAAWWIFFSRSFLDFSQGVGAFAIGLSQISSFFSCSFKYKTKQRLYYIVTKDGIVVSRTLDIY